MYHESARRRCHRDGERQVAGHEAARHELRGAVVLVQVQPDELRRFLAQIARPEDVGRNATAARIDAGPSGGDLNRLEQTVLGAVVDEILRELRLGELGRAYV